MDNKVILITGTNSGFGYLTAKGAAAKGHTVYAGMRNTTNRNADKADELNGIENITVVEIDVTHPTQVQSAIEGIIEKEGKLDVLINNAGYYGGGITETFSEQDMENMFNVNVKGPWRTIKSSLPQMRKQGEGLIINISSGLGRFSAPFMTMYNSTKFALEGLTEGLHYEVRPLGVDAVLVQPGAFPTEIFSKICLRNRSGISLRIRGVGQYPRTNGSGHAGNVRKSKTESANGGRCHFQAY